MTAAIAKPLNADDLKFNPPHFSESVLHNFLKNHYGISGHLSPLAGERDQNVKVSDQSGAKYVLKIAGPDELEETIDFQIKSLLYLQANDPSLSVPVQIKTLSGAQATLLKDDHGRAHWVRLVSYVEGEPLDCHDQLNFDAIRALGQITGRLCSALSGFQHPAARNFMPWDGLNGLIFSPQLRQQYLPDDFKSLAETHLQRLAIEGFPALLALPHQVIHHDGHSGNVMCEVGKPAAITGIIDFGDLIERPIVMDMAIVLSSVMAHNSEILGATDAMLEGYREYMPIPNEQLTWLYDAVAISYILAVQLFSYRAQHNADDPEKIRQENLAGTIEAARSFLEFDRGKFTAHIMRSN